MVADEIPALERLLTLFCSLFTLFYFFAVALIQRLYFSSVITYLRRLSLFCFERATSFFQTLWNSIIETNIDFARNKLTFLEAFLVALMFEKHALTANPWCFPIQTIIILLCGQLPITNGHIYSPTPTTGRVLPLPKHLVHSVSRDPS